MAKVTRTQASIKAIAFAKGLYFQYSRIAAAILVAKVTQDPASMIAFTFAKNF